MNYKVRVKGLDWYNSNPKKELVIDEEIANRIYKNAPKELKRMIEETFWNKKPRSMAEINELYKSNHISFLDVSHVVHFISKKHSYYIHYLADAIKIADVLNKGWEPDWNNKDEKKYTLGNVDGIIKVCITEIKGTDVVFRSKELAQYFIDTFSETCNMLYK